MFVHVSGFCACVRACVRAYVRARCVSGWVRACVAYACMIRLQIGKNVLQPSNGVRTCVRACVRAGECVHACVRACVRGG